MVKLETLKSSELAAFVKKYSPFFVEVKRRILFIFSVLAVATFLGFVFYEKIISFLVNMLNLGGINIVFTSPFQYINLAISCGIATGLIITFPLFIIQILSFLKPALKKKEYRSMVGFIPFSILLFLIGFSFGIVIMRWQIQIFISRSILLGINNVLDFSSLLSTILVTSAFLGVGFQFPIVLLILLRNDIIKRGQLSKQRRWVYLGSFLFAILLPADSIIIDVVLSLPLIFLFELTFILDRIFQYKKARQARLKAV